MNESTNFKIGELAKQTGLTVGTLRYYSDLGLLQPVARGNNGYRYYGQNANKQVEFIKKAQTIGFTLEEIKTILDVRDRGEKPCDLVQNLLDKKIEQLEIQIKKMSLFKQELEEYRLNWINEPNPEHDSQEVCPLIASVSLDATKGLQRETELVLRQLKRKIGQLTPEIEDQVKMLEIEELENLGETLLDFAQLEDLTGLLNNLSTSRNEP
ncbi:putative transcriptional regulator [Xenococcus sp. PCC 7305]|uniref:DUF4351 domain-containing protein n=1 Tax=Xenococcus sp. PCC 7305 TaxID=102125 RepID=UPI0002AD03C6|nr:DUF4351 domain-containing protein [Xenococcus sp. PCC 7305]ELS04072.1 putative transcriptional regulator [Xenococcus sp. PCC 7305]